MPSFFLFLDRAKARAAFRLWPLRGCFVLGRRKGAGDRSKPSWCGACAASVSSHQGTAQGFTCIPRLSRRIACAMLLRMGGRGAGPSDPRQRTPCQSGPGGAYLRAAGGCSSMVEQQPSKLNTRVRFPSPAPFLMFRTPKSRRRAVALWPLRGFFVSGTRKGAGGRSGFEAPAWLCRMKDRATARAALRLWPLRWPFSFRIPAQNGATLPRFNLRCACDSL